jgi:hypothetical protein
VNNEQVILFQMAPNPHSHHVLWRDGSGHRSEPIVAWGLRKDGDIVPLTVDESYGILSCPCDCPDMVGVRVFENLPQAVKENWLAKGVRP